MTRYSTSNENIDFFLPTSDMYNASFLPNTKIWVCIIITWMLSNFARLSWSFLYTKMKVCKQIFISELALNGIKMQHYLNVKSSICTGIIHIVYREGALVKINDVIWLFRLHKIQLSNSNLHRRRLIP